MNPSKMRNNYGKLMYILMDTESYAVKSELRINFIKPLLTVYSFMHSKGLSELLSDPLWLQASASLHDNFGEKSKRDIAREQAAKTKALAALIEKYESGRLA